MIEEAYVSFETAKLLKERKFDIKCNSYFISDNEIALISNRRDFNNHGIYLSAPTQQMAMRWLREVWGIVIVTQPVVGEIGLTWEYRIIKFHLGKGYGSINGTEFIKYGFKSYEEAVEAAIKCCLENLI